MSAFKFKYFTKIELVHSVGEGLKFARVQHRQSGAETTEVEARIATYFGLCCYGSSTAGCSHAVQI